MPALPQGAAETAWRDLRVTWPGRNLLQMCGNTNRPHTRSAATMGNRKCLVQVHVADIGANIARSRQPNHRIEVRAVKINLTAMIVDYFADVLDGFLKYAVCRGVGNHQSSKPVRKLSCFCFQICDVDIAGLRAFDHHNVKSCHRSTRRIGAVSRRGDEADIAAIFTARSMIGANSEQSGIFALAAGVRLQRNSVKASNLAQPIFQFHDHFADTLSMAIRRKRMQTGDRSPRHGHHFRSCIQLHCARTKRDHCAIQCQILVCQPPQEAHHLRFRAVFVEYRLCHERARTLLWHPAFRICAQR